MRISTTNLKRFAVPQGTLRHGPGRVRCGGNAFDRFSARPVGAEACCGVTLPGRDWHIVARSWDSGPQAWQPLLRNTVELKPSSSTRGLVSTRSFEDRQRARPRRGPPATTEGQKRGPRRGVTAVMSGRGAACFAPGVGLAGAGLCQTRSGHAVSTRQGSVGEETGPHRPCPRLAEGPCCPAGRGRRLPGTQRALGTTCWVSNGAESCSS